MNSPEGDRLRSAGLRPERGYEVSWRDDGSAEFVGYSVAGGAFALELGFWIQSRRGCFLLSSIWLVLTIAMVLGIALAGSKGRRELAERRKQSLDEFGMASRERAMLEALWGREERREAIRSGQVQDDGLSDYGREMAKNPELARKNREFEAKFGIPVGSMTEELWSAEEEDRRMASAWEAKMRADSAWDKVREGYYKQSRREGC